MAGGSAAGFGDRGGCDELHGVDDYAAYGVPEIWLWKRQVLNIYGLIDGGYVLQERSRFFSELEVMDLVATCFEEAYERNTSFAIRNLRRRLLMQENS